MEMSSFRTADLQNCLALLAMATSVGMVRLDELESAISDHLAAQIPLTASPIPANRRRPDNITSCPVCGAPAVIVPLAHADRTATATHAIQCQNRPATDQPWRDGMCGHTEYIVRGED